MPDVRTFPPLKTMIENHVKALLADHQSAIWETPHHPGAYQGNAEKILNGLIEAGVITMTRSCPPGGHPDPERQPGAKFPRMEETP